MWISVDEKLPDDSDGLMVPVRFKLTNGDILTGYYWDGDWQWNFSNRKFCWFREKQVTHWMPK